MSIAAYLSMGRGFYALWAPEFWLVLRCKIFQLGLVGIFLYCCFCIEAKWLNILIKDDFDVPSHDTVVMHILY